jgi:hypothetical protein
MLEQKLINVDTAADNAAKVNRELSVVVKKLRKASGVGDLHQLRMWLADSKHHVERLQQLLNNICSVLDFEEEAYLASEAFLHELAEAARTAGVRALLGENTLYSYPLVVKVQPQKRSLLLGKHRESCLRPTFVAQRLRKHQIETGRIAEASFLEVLYTAYALLTRDRESGNTLSGKVVPLTDVYGVLTMLPQASREYTRHDFSVDIYRLDRSRIQRTKSGAFITFPASTGTRATSGTFCITGETGQELRYYGVAFQEPATHP